MLSVVALALLNFCCCVIFCCFDWPTFSILRESGWYQIFIAVGSQPVTRSTTPRRRRSITRSFVRSFVRSFDRWPLVSAQFAFIAQGEWKQLTKFCLYCYGYCHCLSVGRGLNDRQQEDTGTSTYIAIVQFSPIQSSHDKCTHARTVY